MYLKFHHQLLTAALVSIKDQFWGQILLLHTLSQIIKLHKSLLFSTSSLMMKFCFLLILFLNFPPEYNVFDITHAKTVHSSRTMTSCFTLKNQSNTAPYISRHHYFPVSNV
jgi:hypothetical protein